MWAGQELVPSGTTGLGCLNCLPGLSETWCAGKSVTELTYQCTFPSWFIQQSKVGNVEQKLGWIMEFLETCVSPSTGLL